MTLHKNFIIQHKTPNFAHFYVAIFSQFFDVFEKINVLYRKSFFHNFYFLVSRILEKWNLTSICNSVPKYIQKKTFFFHFDSYLASRSAVNSILIQNGSFFVNNWFLSNFCRADAYLCLTESWETNKKKQKQKQCYQKIPKFSFRAVWD